MVWWGRLPVAFGSLALWLWALQLGPPFCFCRGEHTVVIQMCDLGCSALLEGCGGAGSHYQVCFMISTHRYTHTFSHRTSSLFIVLEKLTWPSTLSAQALYNHTDTNLNYKIKYYITKNRKIK